MATLPSPQRLTLPLPLIGAIAGGGLIALGCLALPTDTLEALVTASGVPAVLAAAEPPLGFTARIALALLLGGMTAGFAWIALDMAVGDRLVDLARVIPQRRSVPDGPRPPLSAARELGVPFLEVRAAQAVPLPPVEQPLPRDLDQPLAAYDPIALPAVPLAPTEAVAPLMRPLPEPEPPAAPRPQLIDPGDRFETFELTPLRRAAVAVEPATPSLRAPVEPAAPPVVAPATEASVHDLLARLERGLSERTAPIRSLDATLGDLRRLATGG